MAPVAENVQQEPQVPYNKEEGRGGGGEGGEGGEEKKG
jgi:hypothetical protein